MENRKTRSKKKLIFYNSDKDDEKNKRSKAINCLFFIIPPLYISNGENGKFFWKEIIPYHPTIPPFSTILMERMENKRLKEISFSSLYNSPC